MKNFRSLIPSLILITACVASPLSSAIARVAEGDSISAPRRSSAAQGETGREPLPEAWAKLFDLSGDVYALRPSGYAATLLTAMLPAQLTYTVNSLADTNDGACTTAANGCTLREAINAANINAGADTINFSVTGTINITSALPAITESVTINGGNAIELNGTSAGTGANGLYITGSNVTINSLTINRFNGSGIRIEGTGGNSAQGCKIGTDSAATTRLGNATGVFIFNSPNNVIGSITTPNVISGNNIDGVRIDGNASTGNLVKENHIGTTGDGLSDLGNLFNGVVISNAPNNTIDTNTVSGNDRNGVAITGNSSGNILKLNRIGLSGNAPMPNSQDGIIINNGASNNKIGLGSSSTGNLIAYNSVDGVRIDGSSTFSNTLAGNDIHHNGFNGVVIIDSPGNLISSNSLRYNTTNGLAITGSTATGNLVQINSMVNNNQHGVIITSSASNNVIGASNTQYSQGSNYINNNGGDGIYVDSGTRNKMLTNFIHSNGGLGIDLGADGVAANDPGDGDTGANNLQNYPVISSAIWSSENFAAHVIGTLNSAPNTTFLLQLHKNSACDPSGYGEGETPDYYPISVTTDGNGNAAIDRYFSASIGQFITVTATDPNGNTSEFSPCRVVEGNPPGSLQFSSATYAVGEAGGSAAITVTRAGGTGGTVSVNYASSNGTAAAGSDYTAASGTLTFAPGETSKTFNISVINDTLDEQNETVNLTLSSPTGGATLSSPSSAVLTINDDDAAPSLSVNDVSVTEGNSGAANAVFTVALSAASTFPITVNFATADGTANAPGDNGSTDAVFTVTLTEAGA